MGITLTDKKIGDNLVLLTFELEGGVAEPSDLKELDGNVWNRNYNGKTVIISGRGPIWVYATLTHELHPAVAVATFDPRIGGGVVVQSHSPNYSVGDIIPVES